MTTFLYIWNTYSMDLSPQQVATIQEIEKQINDHVPTGPRILSQQEEKKKKSVLTNLLAAVGISVGTAVVLIVLFTIPFGKKPTTAAPQITTSIVQVEPNISVQAEYINPLSASAQYSNPFIASQNPFASLTQ